MKHFIAAAAALAVASQAFLLPPEVSESDINIVETLDISAADSRIIEIPCPGCPVQVKNRHGKVRVKTNKESHLSLLFKVNHDAESDRLSVNGYDLYPHSDPFHSTLTAPQTIDRHGNKKHGGKWEEKHHKDHMGPSHHEVVSPELGFSLQTLAAKDPTGASQFEKVALDLQIIEVGSTFIDGMPDIRIQLVKDNEGRLTLENVNVVTSQTASFTSPLPSDTKKQCNNPMCKWIAFIEGKLGRPLSNCANKNKQGNHAGVSAGSARLPSHHKFRPGQVQRPQRTWGQLVKNVASHILLPVLIGIVAGVGASLLGMMAGTFVIMVWRTFFRKHNSRCRHARRHKAAHKEAAAAEEKAGLMDEQSLPPAYEEDTKEEPPKDAPVA